MPVHPSLGAGAPDRDYWHGTKARLTRRPGDGPAGPRCPMDTPVLAHERAAIRVYPVLSGPEDSLAIESPMTPE
jgi:hypothetical protein